MRGWLPIKVSDYSTGYFLFHLLVIIRRYLASSSFAGLTIAIMSRYIEIPIIYRVVRVSNYLSFDLPHVPCSHMLVIMKLLRVFWVATVLVTLGYCAIRSTLTIHVKQSAWRDRKPLFRCWVCGSSSDHRRVISILRLTSRAYFLLVVGRSAMSY